MDELKWRSEPQTDLTLLRCEHGGAVVEHWHGAPKMHFSIEDPTLALIGAANDVEKRVFEKSSIYWMIDTQSSERERAAQGSNTVNRMKGGLVPCQFLTLLFACLQQYCKTRACLGAPPTLQRTL